ncbi:hypothetical protein [Deinococcus arcticus]|nr:hypothetical protein [Deinococcus arcticus]
MTPLLSTATDTLTYQAGQNTFGGITTVTLYGNGQAKVTRQRGQTRQAFTGTVPPALLKQVNAALAVALAVKVPGNYQPVPDEARIQVKVQANGQVKTLAFWQNQAQNTAALGEVLKVLNKVVGIVSGGRVTH